MWTVHLKAREMDMLDSGKSVEKITTDGVLVLMMDEEGMLHLTWVGEGLKPRTPSEGY